MAKDKDDPLAIENENMAKEKYFTLNTKIDFKEILRSIAIVSNSQIAQYFINSNNEDYLIFISILKDKVYQLFIEFKDKLRMPFDSNRELIKKMDEKDQSHVTSEMILKRLIRSFSVFARNLTKFVRYIPGLDVLSIEDLEIILSEQVYLLHLLRYAKTFVNGECYTVLEGIQMRRCWFEIFRGKYATDLIFEFFRVFNSLNLTERELAVFYPFVLCSPGN